MSFIRAVGFTLAIASLAALSGCSVDGLRNTEGGTSPTSTITLHGRAMGGQQPVVGATVKLYKVSTSGDGKSSTSMLNGTGSVTTDLNGSFNFTGDYTCGTATEVFLVVTGGNPGAGGTNSNLSLMAALGACSSLTSSTTVIVNELSTIAAIASVQTFMTAPTSIGSSTYDASALAADFTSASELVNMSTGASPGTGIPSGYTVNSTLINTLGDIVAPCINSTGGTAGDNSACGNLFLYATPPTGTAPTDTATAVLNILNHPTLNTTQLFGLINGAAPFQTALSSAPSTYAVSVAPNAATITRTFIVFPATYPDGAQPDASVAALYNFINSAQHTIDMTMYEMQDTTFTADLVAACNRGVRVRVIFSSSVAGSSSTAYNTLNSSGANCSAVDSNSAFTNTHQKTITIDGAYSNAQTAILSLNLQTQYYSTTRDFAEIENDSVDIAAIETTFNQDYAAGGSNNSTEFSYLPGNGRDLIWSPTNARSALTAIINNATSTLLVENEEMSDSGIVTALENACTRGVTVHITMTNDGSYTSEFTALKAAGCSVHTYVSNSTNLYIHAKIILADYGTSGVVCYMGSINFSTASLTDNRELGLYVTDSASQQTIYNTVVSDYSGGTAF